MSITKIITNIQQNIVNRKGAEDLLIALEMLTRNPLTFKTMVNEGKFSQLYQKEQNNQEHTNSEQTNNEQLPPNRFRISGFMTPVKLSYNLKTFITKGYFGFDTKYMMAVTNGVCNRAILTPLFNLYAKANNMRSPDIKQWLSATPLMYELFSTTFDDIKKTKPEFNPENFKYEMFKSIISLNIDIVDFDIVNDNENKMMDQLENDYKSISNYMESTRFSF